MKRFICLLLCSIVLMSGCSSKPQNYTEIEKVLKGKKDFTYIYTLYRYNEPYENPGQGALITNRPDFKYDWYADELEDGSIDMWEDDAQWEKWTSVDLDCDGEEEVIYLITMGPNEFYIIFHEIDGEVYGYAVGPRNINNLYRDGTIVGTGGASYWWYERIEEFTPDGYTRNVFARAEDNKFTIEGQDVDEETFRNYMLKRDENVGLVEWIPE